MHEITVVLAVYNGMEYLRENIESVLSQTLQNFEFLILDDCSNDGSWEYLNSLNDDRITLIRNERNRGLFYNLNFLIKRSKGKLIKLWSQDDVMYPHCLQYLVDFHSAYPDLGFSFCRIDYFYDKDFRPLPDIETNPNFIDFKGHALTSFYVGSIAGNIANVCIPKQVFDRVGYFNEQMKISADFEMWVRISKDYRIANITEKLVILRNHNKQLSRKESLYVNHIIEDMQVYTLLKNYIKDDLVIKQGRQLLRKYKHNFYYTLMVQELLKRNFKNFTTFFNLINQADNVWLQTFYFIYSRTLGFKPPKL